MVILDVHSHVLPGIDDGSRNIETSLAMLTASHDQGVDRIYATPHFYARKDTPGKFLERRNAAYQDLMAAIEKEDLSENIPEIRLGAEVAFFHGISRAEEVTKLTYEGSNLLLLEMPFEPWSEDNMREVYKLRERFQLVFAHLERFTGFRENKAYIRDILEGPDYVQVNAESVIGFGNWMRFGKWFKEGQVDFLGSDAHGMHHRPPNMGQGREVLAKKCGAAYLENLDSKACSLL